MTNLGYYQSPCGLLEIVASDKTINQISFVNRFSKAHDNALTKKCVVELKEYFEGQREKFDLPLQLLGTPFEVNVLLALSKVPYGYVISYQDLAAMAGHPQAARAIGQAIHKNPLSIVIPCHRVVGSSGALTGYAGGLAKKSYLLKLENGFD